MGAGHVEGARAERFVDELEPRRLRVLPRGGHRLERSPGRLPAPVTEQLAVGGEARLRKQLRVRERDQIGEAQVHGLLGAHRGNGHGELLPPRGLGVAVDFILEIKSAVGRQFGEGLDLAFAGVERGFDEADIELVGIHASLGEGMHPEFMETVAG